EETGSFTNSSRVLSWKEAAIDPPGEAKVDSEIVARLFMRLRELYAKEGGTLPEPVLALHWPYLNANVPTSPELLREISGKALVDLTDPKDPSKVLVKG